MQERYLFNANHIASLAKVQGAHGIIFMPGMEPVTGTKGKLFSLTISLAT